ncbi:MAG: tyrosine-type recombinase/integrase [Lautropia sp.]
MSTRFNFTKAAIDALPLPAAGQRSTFHDTHPRANGLQLRVTSTGVRTFTVLRRIRGGAPARVTIGRYPGVTIEQARVKAGQAGNEYATGVDPTGSARERRQSRTFGELWELYRDRHLVPKKRRTVDDLVVMFDRFLGEVPDEPAKPRGVKRGKPKCGVDWRRRKAQDITQDEVARLHERIGREVGETTANRVLELVRAIFNRTMRMRLYPGPNPADGIDEFGEKSRTRYLLGDEIPAFFKAIEAEPSRWAADFFLLALLTGARKGNVMAMRFSDIDFAEGRWHVPGELSKNGEPLVIPLTAPAVEIIERRRAEIRAARVQAEEKAAAGDTPEASLPDPDGFVFPSRSASGHITSPKRQWARLLERAGLQDVRIHDLRRSLGSWMVNSGASMAMIGAALGHKDAKSTRVYARLAVDPVRDAMEKAAANMLGKAKQAGDPAKVVELEARRKA